MSSSSVARVSAVFGVLAIAAIPAGAAIPTFVDTIGVLRASLIAVPVAFLLGLIAISLARRAKFRLDRSVRRRGARTVRSRPSSPGRASTWRSRAGSRSASTACCAARRAEAVVRSWRRVRDREQPPRSPVAAQGRVRPGRAGNEDPGQVPARARGRALRRAAVGDLRQGLPAHLRRLPRAGRPALRRRVQLPLRRRGRPRVAAAALAPRATSAASGASRRASCCSCSRSSR